MVLVYRFKKEKVGKNYVSRPKIPIRLSWKGENLNAIALIDSGADITIVPPEIAEMLKLEFSEEHEIETYRESIKAKRSFVKSHLLENLFVNMLRFQKFQFLCQYLLKVNMRWYLVVMGFLTTSL